MLRPALSHPAIIGSFRPCSSIRADAAAEAGYEIERVRFDRPLPLAAGFAEAADYIQAAGRPLTSFCALRIALAGGVSPRTAFADVQRALCQDAVGVGSSMTARPIRSAALAMSARRSSLPSEGRRSTPSRSRVDSEGE